MGKTKLGLGRWAIGDGKSKKTKGEGVLGKCGMVLGWMLFRFQREFRISGNEVKIFRKGKQVILEPIETAWEQLFESLSEFPEDFMKDGRNQPVMQKRESF